MFACKNQESWFPFFLEEFIHYLMPAFHAFGFQTLKNVELTDVASITDFRPIT